MTPTQSARIDERELFEAWCKEVGLSTKRLNDQQFYRVAKTHNAWCGWKARAQLDDIGLHGRPMGPLTDLDMK